MRKVEEQMVAAVKARRPMKCGNTTVERFEPVMVVKLHGNTIAKIEDGSLTWQWTLAGWNTVTTRSRVNALSRAFGGDSVGTIKGTPHIGGRNGHAIRSDEWVIAPMVQS